jgi:DNA ligase-1
MKAKTSAICHLSKEEINLQALLKISGNPLYTSLPLFPFTDWDQLKHIRTGARNIGSEGLMLKRKNSIYQAGPKKRRLVEMEN